jgi:putative ABC transport system permease protein
MGIFLRIALRNLVQARRRTALLSLALALVTLFLAILLALSQGLTETMIQSVTAQSTGHVNVAGFFKLRATDAIPLVTNAAEVRAIVSGNTPGLDYVVMRSKGWGKLISDTSSIQVGIYGLIAAEEDRFLGSLPLARESEYRDGGRDEVLGDPRRLSEPQTTVMFAAQARKLGVTVGDKLSVTVETEQGQANVLDVTVVAVARDSGFMSAWTLYIPNDTLMQLYDLRTGATGAVMVYLKDIEQSETVMSHLREVFASRGYALMDHDGRVFWEKFESVQGQDWRGQKLDLTTWKDEASWLLWILRAFDSVSFVLVAILTAIIAIGIMNAMWIAVRERTREIGTMRAIGLGRRGVLGLFLVEALLLGLFATTIGGILGAVVAWAVDAAEIDVTVDAVKVLLMSDTVHLSVRAGQVVEAVLAFTAVTCLATLWPAARAARMQPVKAIQNAG